MIRIVNATKKGYTEMLEGGVLDLSFPESKTRRGRVIDKGRISPTLDTGCQVGVAIVDDRFPGSRPPRFYEDAAPTIKGGQES
jgi:DNA (cytosine-5)-methyltransferase 1